MTSTSASARVLAAVVVTAAVGAVAWLLFTGGSSYHLTARLTDASQLVKGDLVKVGGLEIGTVSDIRLGDDGVAEVELSISDDDFNPLHRGTRAVVRQSSLSSIANRYVAIEPGANDGARLDDGDTIPLEDTQAAVDLDQLIGVFDAKTRSALQDLLHGSADQLDGREAELNEGLRYLSPALSQTSATLREITRDQAAFERFLVESATVVSAVASRESDLDQGLVDAAAVTETLAGETDAIRTILAEAAPTMRQANTTFVDTRAALDDLRPTLRLAQPVAPRLARTLRTLSPVARDARPTLSELRAAVPDLGGLLDAVPPLEKSAIPVLEKTDTTVKRAMPIVDGARVALPDVVSGLLIGFGGSAAGYWDVNGSAGRVALQAGQYSLTGAPSLLPLPPLLGATPGNTRRCPGAAAPAREGELPYDTKELPCDPKQVVK